MLIPLRETCNPISAVGCLLADKLNINLLGILKVEINQFIEAWLPGKFSGSIRLIVAVEGIPNGSQFGLKVLPEQEAELGCLSYLVGWLVDLKADGKRHLKTLYPGNVWITQHDTTSRSNRPGNITTRSRRLTRRGLCCPLPRMTCLRQRKLLQHGHKSGLIRLLIAIQRSNLAHFIEKIVRGSDKDIYILAEAGCLGDDA